MLVVGSIEYLTCREYSDVIYQRCRVPDSATSVCSEHYRFVRGILQCSSWRETSSYLAVVLLVEILAQTEDGCELLIRFECVLSEKTAVHKVGDAVIGCCILPVGGPHGTAEVLVVAVECSAETESVLMNFVCLVLVDEVHKGRVLVSEVACSSKV